MAASSNRAGITLGDIAWMSRRGRECMRARCESAEDDAGKAVVKWPAGVHIQKVYGERNSASPGD